MFAHSTAHTVGLFWLNASETWIETWRTGTNDDAASSSSTNVGWATQWISESGQMELFVLPGFVFRSLRVFLVFFFFFFFFLKIDVLILFFLF
jgi:hypothetical protein